MIANQNNKQYQDQRPPHDPVKWKKDGWKIKNQYSYVILTK